MMDEKSIREVACDLRKVLEEIAHEPCDVQFYEFPKGACGPASELVCRYFREVLRLDAKYISADRSDECSHAWVSVSGFIVDITADQFDQAPVIVAENSQWHEQWESDPPREPITSRNNWPMYPISTWNLIVREMKLRGYPCPSLGEECPPPP